MQFTEDERALYKAVEQRAVVTLNKYLREDNVMKNYSSILAMLVRLRQVPLPVIRMLTLALHPSIPYHGTHPRPMVRSRSRRSHVRPLPRKSHPTLQTNRRHRRNTSRRLERMSPLSRRARVPDHDRLSSRILFRLY